MPLPVRPSDYNGRPPDLSNLTVPIEKAAKAVAVDALLLAAKNAGNVAKKAGNIAETAERIRGICFDKAGEFHRDVHPPGT